MSMNDVGCNFCKTRGVVLLCVVKLYRYNYLVLLIFQFPIYLEPSPQLPIYQVTINHWFQIYRELENDGIHIAKNQDLSLE